ncbi:MAG: BatA and WFA domain-containing protein [Planctomycetes bacterium]|nr:BatA and WFA domain-containing protein [Planctomycetota bacterium]
MNWLSPWIGVLAAGLTVPPLVALYFLKLKRRVAPVPSTLLWKRAVQDLQVNAPFQRLRRNLLLLLQLMILLFAALALAKPMVEALKTREQTLILLIDQSASMGVVEADGRSRLDIAKEQAKTLIDDMDAGSRAMVVAFCDRATSVCPFETNRNTLKRQIDSIQPTESTTLLAEGFSLAEAYSQNLIIAGNEPGSDIAPTSAAPPATAIIFSDGAIADAGELVLERLETGSVELVTVGQRSDNVGITSMAARRNYDRPETLHVMATVQNFGAEPIELDAALYVQNELLDIQTITLSPGIEPDQIGSPVESDAASAPAPEGSQGAITFDEITFAESGVVEIRLRTSDALPADNRAWIVVPASRSVQVLLVTRGNFFLERMLASLPLKLMVMTPDAYESAPQEQVSDGRRSLFDVVMLDDHSTDRLPVGNYFFWGGVPELDGVEMGDWVTDEVMFNWDETHPVLRHVHMETVDVDRWRRLALPSETVTLIEGETSPILSHLSRDGSEYLICAFPLLVRDSESGEPMVNTDWVQELHFVPFMHNAMQYLSATLVTAGMQNVLPGEPVKLPVPEGTTSVRIHRPDGTEDEVPSAGYASVHYAKTRTVGVYRAEPGVDGQDYFAVNLFSPAESRVAPNRHLTIGGAVVAASESLERINEPLWQWPLLAVLAVLLLEWIVYNKRVFV